MSFIPTRKNPASRGVTHLIARAALSRVHLRLKRRHPQELVKELQERALLHGEAELQRVGVRAPSRRQQGGRVHHALLAHEMS